MLEINVKLAKAVESFLNNKIGVDMSEFIIFKKLSPQVALDTMKQIEQWFRDNPKKKNCKTDLFTIRRGYLVEDILKHSEPLIK